MPGVEPRLVVRPCRQIHHGRALCVLAAVQGMARLLYLIEIVYKESDEAERYMTYQIDKWPYVSVIDPRYRARLLYLREVRFCTYYVLEIKGPARTW